MQKSNAIETDFTDNALIIRFVRPEMRNPLSVSVLKTLGSLIEKVSESKDISRVIFVGADKSFASGADLREIASIDSSDEAKSFARLGQDIFKRITELDVQTVAAINGFCFGGGLDLALSCNVRIAAPFATFCHPGSRLGIITGWGGTQRLPLLIGQANASLMLFTADQIDAATALRFGLVDSIAEDVLAAALQIS